MTARQDPAVGRSGPPAAEHHRPHRAHWAARPSFDWADGLQLRAGRAANTLPVSDYFENEKRWWLRLHEKGGKRHEVPCHHSLRKYLDAWIEAAGIGGDKKGWLFRSIRKGNHLTTNRMDTNDVLRMIKRRAKAAAGLPYSTCCHTFRATGITTYLKN